MNALKYPVELKVGVLQTTENIDACIHLEKQQPQQTPSIDVLDGSGLPEPQIVIDTKGDRDRRARLGGFVNIKKDFSALNTTVDGTVAVSRVKDFSLNNMSEQKKSLDKMRGTQVELASSVSIHNPKNGLGGSASVSYVSVDVPHSAKKEIMGGSVNLHAQNVAKVEGLDAEVGAFLSKETKDLQLISFKEQLENNVSKGVNAKVGYTLPTDSKAWRVEGEVSHQEEYDKVTKEKQKETKGMVSASFKF